MAATDLKITYTSTPEQIEAMHSYFDDAISEVRGELGRTYPLIIDGEEITGRETFDVHAPADRRTLVGVFQKGTADDVERAVAAFGVATECGLGRRPPETIHDLLRLHAQIAAPIVRELAAGR